MGFTSTLAGRTPPAFERRLPTVLSFSASGALRERAILVSALTSGLGLVVAARCPDLCGRGHIYSARDERHQHLSEGCPLGYPRGSRFYRGSLSCMRVHERACA